MTMPLNQNVVPNPRHLHRGFARFQQIISAATSPIVLLEGSRNVPDAVAQKMQSLAAHLMKKFPTLIARSGNAQGSDTAWARGVNQVAPERLQLILPVPNYRAKSIAPENETLALPEAASEDYGAAWALCRDQYQYGSRKGAEAFDPLPSFKKNYLERDALKVLGYTDYKGKRRKATAALFYIDPERRNGGGTGHTVRLCEAEAVPYFLVDDWLQWMPIY
jgi:hypothetical protein